MKEITAAELKNTVATAALPLIVDIYSPQCAPCRSLLPVLNDLETEFAGKIDFVKVNALADDESTKTCGDLRVRNVPVLIIFKGGTEVARRVGAASETELKSWIATYV